MFGKKTAKCTIPSKGSYIKKSASSTSSHRVESGGMDKSKAQSEAKRMAEKNSSRTFSTATKCGKTIVVSRAKKKR